MVTPLTVTIGWLDAYFGSLFILPDVRKACCAASRACRIGGKEFSRCLISTGTLTVPVVGGANRLKRRDAEPLLSEHGKWRREHLGAWQAAYGRSPYYEHLMPALEDVYARSEGMTLELFNSELLAVALSWVDADCVGSLDPRLAKAKSEIREQINPDISIFDTIFRLGKEVTLAIRCDSPQG